MTENAKIPTKEELAGTIMTIRMDARIFWDSPQHIAKVAAIYGLKVSDIFVEHYKKALEWLRGNYDGLLASLMSAMGTYTNRTMTFSLPSGVDDESK